MKTKYLIIAFLFAACKPANTEPIKNVSTEPTPVLIPHQCPVPETIVLRDTVLITKNYDSLITVIKRKNDSLFVERYKLERIKYYNNIAQKNPSQREFLIGWINRVLYK